MIDRSLKRRMILVTALLLAAMSGVSVRLAYLHLGPNEHRVKAAERASTFEDPLPVARGRIFGSGHNGTILAMNQPVKDVCVDPARVAEKQQQDSVIRALTAVLATDEAQVLARLSETNRRFAYVQRFVPEEKTDELQQMNLTGVFFRDTSTRYYPHGMFMCHLLGFANLDGIGSAGVEQMMDKYLRGCPGLRVGRQDGHHRELYNERIRDVPGQDGDDVYLTVDQNLQYMVERALDTAMEKHQAKGAWAIIQKVRTGEILAIASRPAFDLNEFRTASLDVLLNRAIGTVYEPGSTIKPATIALALSQGIVTPSTTFDCENGAWMYAGKVLRDLHPYGLLSVADILKKSSNVGTAKIAVELGEKRLDQGFRSFGYGSVLGVDLPGEEKGILHPLSDWSKLSVARVSIGQGVAVTALQMLGMMCCIANDGFLMRPRVIDRVVGPRGNVILKNEPEVLARPIGADTAALMRYMLSRVTEEGGTGKRACVDGYLVAGKTGTAQKAVPGGYSDTAYVASFVGFMPADHPEIGIIVVVDEPQPYHTGGYVAAPVFGEIAEQAARYLDIPPSDLKEQNGTSRPALAAN